MKGSAFISDPSHRWEAASSVEDGVVWCARVITLTFIREREEVT